MHFCEEEVRLLLACLTCAGPAAAACVGWLASSCGGHTSADAQEVYRYTSSVPDGGPVTPGSAGDLTVSVELR